MRLAMEHFKRGFTVHHGRLRTRLISIRSLLHYLTYQVYDRGITLTPSYVRKDEVLSYLLDTYGSEEMEVVKSFSYGTFEVDNYLMLEFGSKVTKNENLSKDLDLLSSYYRTRVTEKNLSRYLNRKRSLKGNVSVKAYAKFEYGRIKFNGVTDLSYHENYYTVGEAKEIFVSHIFYDAMADYAGFKRDNEWTFREELDREQEGKFIQLIIEGAIKPNTELGKKAHKAYMRAITTKTKNIIFEETFMRRMEEIDDLTKWVIDNDKQLKGVSDYSVIYEENGEEISHVPVHASYFAWDYDYNEPLDDINRLRGIGGEFTREYRDDMLPYEVYIDGKIVDMFPVEIEGRQKKVDSYLESLQLEYLEDIKGLTEVNNSEDEQEYCITADILQPMGVPYLGEDDYVRVLNATDLELSGDVTVYMANMFPKLNLKAQSRSVEEYQNLGSEEDYNLKQHAKTIIDEQNNMFIKQHLKYYNSNQYQERVVEGLVMLSEDLVEPTLLTLVSGTTAIPLSLNELTKKRLGVYVKEKESMYAYKFLVMYNTETKQIAQLTDSVTGLDKRGKSLYSLPLLNLGLDEDKEEAFKELVRKTILDKVMDCDSSNEYYKQVLTKELVEA